MKETFKDYARDILNGDEPGGSIWVMIPGGIVQGEISSSVEMTHWIGEDFRESDEYFSIMNATVSAGGLQIQCRSAYVLYDQVSAWGFDVSK